MRRIVCNGCPRYVSGDSWRCCNVALASNGRQLVINVPMTNLMPPPKDCPKSLEHTIESGV